MTPEELTHEQEIDRQRYAKVKDARPRPPTKRREQQSSKAQPMKWQFNPFHSDTEPPES